jgi:hypothetical protein
MYYLVGWKVIKNYLYELDVQNVKVVPQHYPGGTEAHTNATLMIRVFHVYNPLQLSHFQFSDNFSLLTIAVIVRSVFLAVGITFSRTIHTNFVS